MNPKNLSVEELKSLSCEFVQNIPYLTLLVLFGSRARGDTHARSDWDFGALYDPEIRKSNLEHKPFGAFEVPLIISQILQVPDHLIDVVELDRCSKSIAHEIACDGKVLYERNPGEFKKFQEQSRMTQEELRSVNQELRNKIDQFLQEWEIV